MTRTTLVRWAIAPALIILGMTWACADPITTTPEPRFEGPTGAIIGLDRSKRLSPGGDFGGRQAMAEISAQVGNASRDSDDPLIRAVAEWRDRLDAESAGGMWTSGDTTIETYDSDYYAWTRGESYAPAHKRAKFLTFVAEASRLTDGPVDVNVVFKFDGHAASNVAEWTLTNSAGEELRTRSLGSFGSQEDGLLGLGAFKSREWVAHSAEYDVGCDVRVQGSTRANAWYEGVWDVNGVSVGVNPTGPNGNLSLTRRRSGVDEASKAIKTYFTCPPTGGYGGDDCYACQQWFQPLEDGYTLEWWECERTDPSECFGDEI